MKKVLLTGATGLIGKELIKPLLDNGYKIFAISRKAIPNSNTVAWLAGDLFDTQFIKSCCKKAQADILVHLAWKVTRDYAYSNENFSFLASSISLLQEFQQNGGKQVFISGSFSEYDDSKPFLTENTPINANDMLYTFCKNKLHEISEKFCRQNALDFCYGRIFNVFGHNEDDKRLTKYILNCLSQDKEAIIKSGPLQKDYLYSREIARAIVHILNKNYTGTINICSGKPVTIKELALKFAKKFNKEHLLKFENNFGNQPQIIYGDNSILCSQLKYQYFYTLDQAVDEVFEEYQKNLIKN